jgi:hypothetical protein
MAKTAFRTWVLGEIVTAAMMNEQIRDNGNEIWKGTTAGDIDYYTSATTKARLGIGTAYQRLAVVSGIPTWVGYQGCGLTDTTATQAIGTGADTEPSQFDTETFDSNGYHAASNNYMTIPVGLGGLYMVSAYAYFDGNATDDKLREIGLKIAGTTILRASFVQDADGGNTHMCISAPVLLADGDTVRMVVQQITGGNLNLRAWRLSIARIG